MELNKTALGISLGLIWGLAVMLGTWWLMYNGSPGATISKLGAFYFGYCYSFWGSIIGFIWGFIDGFICGFLIAWIYNMFNKPAKAKATE
jgi:ABC-type nitrate/sulfonate/bicarbonate transport system permease component